MYRKTMLQKLSQLSLLVKIKRPMASLLTKTLRHFLTNKSVLTLPRSQAEHRARHTVMAMKWEYQDEKFRHYLFD